MSHPFTTLALADAPVVTAPDGSAVRLLAGLSGGGMATFRLEAGQVAAAAIHRTVEEIWFVTEGRGAIWRRSARRQPACSPHPRAGRLCQFRPYR